MVPAITFDRLLKSLSLASLIVFLSVLFYRPIETDDVWWHLKVGKFIFENRQIPRIDPFHPVDGNVPWILNQWLGSLVYFLVYHWTGYTGLKIFRLLFFLFCLGVFFLYARKKIPLSFLIPLIFVISCGLLTRCLLRPLVSNFLFIQLLLIILSAYRDNNNSKWIWVIPLMGIVWFNLHLGSFVYGTLILLIYAASFLIASETESFQRVIKSARSAYFIPKESPKDFSQNINSRTQLVKAKRLFVILFCFLASFILNPYGLAGVLQPFKIFLIPQTANFALINNMISEVLPPTEILTNPLANAWFFIIFVFCIIAIGFDKKRPISNVLLFFVSVFFFIHGRRGSELFVFTAAYILVQSLDNISFKKKWEGLKSSGIIERIMLGAMILILAANITHLLNNRILTKNVTKSYLNSREDFESPHEVLKILNDNKITGPIFNSHEYGGYLLWFEYPNLKPIIDGRQVDQTILMEYLNVVRYPQQQWKEFTGKYKINIALINAHMRINERILKYLNANLEWQLIFIDKSAVLYTKKNIFTLPGSLKNYAQEIKSYDNAELIFDNVTAKTALSDDSKPIENFIQFLNPPPIFIDQLEEGITLFDMGFHGAGLSRLYQARQLVDAPHTRYALFLALQELKLEKEKNR